MQGWKDDGHVELGEGSGGQARPPLVVPVRLDDGLVALVVQLCQHDEQSVDVVHGPINREPARLNQEKVVTISMRGCTHGAKCTSQARELAYHLAVQLEIKG